MTRMAEERDSILRIRAKVDSYDEMVESTVETSPSDSAESTAESPRLVLCAPQKRVLVQRILPRIASLTADGLTGQEFSRKLFHFLRDFTGTTIKQKDILSCTVRLLM